MDERSETAGRAPDAHKALETAELAQTPSPDELWRKANEPGNGHETHGARQACSDAAPLLPPDESEHLRGTWNDVQTGFVDSPQRAVERADNLVNDAVKRLSESFAAQRSTLEQQWNRGDQVSTEELRLALQRYRSFFNRLLSM